MLIFISCGACRYWQSNEVGALGGTLSAAGGGYGRPGDSWKLRSLLGVTGLGSGLLLSPSSVCVFGAATRKACRGSQKASHFNPEAQVSVVSQLPPVVWWAAPHFEGGRAYITGQIGCL